MPASEHADGMTIKQFFDGMEEWNAGIATLTAFDADDKPTRALIGVVGEGVGDVLKAVDEVEARLDAKKDSDERNSSDA